MADKKVTDFKTSSIAWPNLINVAQNEVAVLTNEKSVVNRSKLLILTEPTEIYNEPNQGVGLRRHLWHYNNANEEAIIKDRIVEQLRLHEPQCTPEDTQFAPGNLFTGANAEESAQKYNILEMTVAVKTIFGSTASIDFTDIPLS